MKWFNNDFLLKIEKLRVNFYCQKIRIIVKHLKYFESKSDGQFHIDQVKDLLQEVIDEFGLDRSEYGIGDGDGASETTGYLYTLENSVGKHPVIELTIFYRPENSHILGVIRGDIKSKQKEFEIRTRMDEIRDSVEIKGFEKRLESIGYSIKKYQPTGRTSFTNIFMIDIRC